MPYYKHWWDTHVQHHSQLVNTESMASGRLLDAAFQLHYTVKELKVAREADDYSLKQYNGKATGCCSLTGRGHSIQ